MIMLRQSCLYLENNYLLELKNKNENISAVVNQLLKEYLNQKKPKELNENEICFNKNKETSESAYIIWLKAWQKERGTSILSELNKKIDLLSEEIHKAEDELKLINKQHLPNKDLLDHIENLRMQFRDLYKERIEWETKIK